MDLWLINQDGNHMIKCNEVYIYANQTHYELMVENKCFGKYTTESKAQEIFNNITDELKKATNSYIVYSMPEDCKGL